MLSAPSQFGPGMPKAGQFWGVFWPAGEASRKDGGRAAWLWVVGGAEQAGDASPATQRRAGPHTTLWRAVTANVGYWATLSLNIPDFTRYAHSQKDQVMGQAIGEDACRGLVL